jgi:hypothetical protein
MSAWDWGYAEGITYLEAHAEVTCSQYLAEGRRRAGQYLRCDRQAAYQEGWQRAGDDYEPDWQEWMERLFHFFEERRRRAKKEVRSRGL